MIAAILLASGLVSPPSVDSDAPTRAEVAQALRSAVAFFHWQVSAHGGYAWRYSADLKDHRGEGIAGPTRAWVQPPGTPTVGSAMLDAYKATGDPHLLDAARDAAYALVRGQLKSGGWHYSIEFAPADRAEIAYQERPNPPKGARNRSTLDDDTTQAAIRFLMRMDEALGFEDRLIHEAATRGLEALVGVQAPNGGWYVWWEAFPERAGQTTEETRADVRASYPERWDREWQNDWPARYVINDNLVANAIDTLLLAHDVYDEPRWLEAARRAGEFLILAQMPEPQPAWAQQYDAEMQPCWARKFEPPAVTGGESQEVMRALMRLYRATGEERFLKPIPKAIAYLRASERPDGRLARFYELETNRPLYFTKDYQLTYSNDDMPTHYAFIVGSRLDAIEKEYLRLKEEGPEERAASTGGSIPAAQARSLIEALDGRGAWVEDNSNGSGIIQSSTFVRNLRTLSRYLEGLDEADSDKSSNSDRSS